MHLQNGSAVGIIVRNMAMFSLEKADWSLAEVSVLVQPPRVNEGRVSDLILY